ncbi:MAG: molecular chaperone TorD family protein [Dyella sp.]|nr:molecular chaperone TorD family protein [Dyella sp.]MBV8270776.1 molecular chaperone TorD family protein [Cupriavidus sp.]
MTTTLEQGGIADVTVAWVLEWVADMLMAPPTEASVAQMRSPEGRAVFDAMADEWSSHAAMRQMLAALNPGEPAGAVAADLSVTYTRLFEGVSGTPAVSLYESTYAIAGCQDQAPPRLYGRAAGEMDELLRRFGMRLDVSGEAPDHISVELALYAALLRRGDRAGVALMRKRLAGWVPALIDGCVVLDPEGIYGGIARLLKSLLEAQGPDGWTQPVPRTDAQDGSHYVE